MKFTSLGKPEKPNEQQVLLYYPAFPHYRVSVLEELQDKLGETLDIVSGSRGRRGLQILTENELPGLQVLSSKSAGKFSWEGDVVSRAVSKRYVKVILAPAVSSLSTWAVLVLRRVLGRTTLLWGQCGKPGDKSPKRLLQEIMNRLANGLLIYGSAEEMGAREYGTPARKVHRVHNAVPLRPIGFTVEQLDRHITERVEDARQRGELRLIYVGRINDAKNVHVLLQAGELLKKSYSNFTLCLVGDGPDREKLRELYPDPRYTFLGSIYDEAELTKVISGGTFVVSPSTMGLLALDALAAGTPVLVPNHPRNGSEVDALSEHVNAFRFQHDDPRELTKVVDVALDALAQRDANVYYSHRERNIKAWSSRGVANNILETMATY